MSSKPNLTLHAEDFLEASLEAVRRARTAREIGRQLSARELKVVAGGSMPGMGLDSGMGSDGGMGSIIIDTGPTTGMTPSRPFPNTTILSGQK